MAFVARHCCRKKNKFRALDGPRVCSAVLIESAMVQDGSSLAAARCAPAGLTSQVGAWFGEPRVGSWQGTAIVMMLFNASKNFGEVFQQ